MCCLPAHRLPCTHRAAPFRRYCACWQAIWHPFLLAGHQAVTRDELGADTAAARPGRAPAAARHATHHLRGSSASRAPCGVWQKAGALLGPSHSCCFPLFRAARCRHARRCRSPPSVLRRLLTATPTSTRRPSRTSRSTVLLERVALRTRQVGVEVMKKGCVIRPQVRAHRLVFLIDVNETFVFSTRGMGTTRHLIGGHVQVAIVTILSSGVRSWSGQQLNITSTTPMTLNLP